MRSSHCCAVAGVDWHDESHTITLSSLGMLLGQSEGGCAAHRQAGKMRLVDCERVHQREHVVHEQLECVTAAGRFGAAVAALVVAEHAECTLELARLILP